MNISSYDYASIIGKQLGTVTTLKMLGRGAMGAVFVAFQHSLKRQVAVKVLPKSLAMTELSRQQFRDEAEIIASLSHPNIIPIFEMGETDTLYFQVMQLVQGADLGSILRNRLKHPLPSKRLLPRESTLHFIMDILDGLAYAHEEEVVHQDIKPANILIETRRNRPLIADFGIAKAAQLEYKAQGLLVGTPLYLSPEQARAQATDARADIYSTGVILFEMLAGALPLRREPVKQMLHRKARTPDTLYTMRPSETSPLIDTALERIILRAVAPHREDRYPDCRTFRDELMDYVRRGGPAVAVSKGSYHGAFQ